MTSDFLQSPEWVEQLYLAWQEDPSAVSAQWQAYFSGFQLAEIAVDAGGDSMPPANALHQGQFGEREKIGQRVHADIRVK